MESPDNELLVDVRPHSLYGEGENVPNDIGYNINALKENLVQGGKKASTPEQEGNINCAMDVFAPDQSSMSSANSRLSSSSAVGKPHSTSSEPKDTSDSDRISHFKAKMSNNYTTLLNDHDQQDTTSLASDSSAGDGINNFSLSMYSPKHSPSTPSRKPPSVQLQHAALHHFPNSNISFPKPSPGTQWTVFGENKENKLAKAESTRNVPARPPPAIPDRKSLRNRNAVARASPVVCAQSPSPSADLLSMDNDDLDFHLSDASSPVPHAPAVVKPAVPPRRSLFSVSSTASGSGSHADDSDNDLLTVVAPEPEGHINHAHSSSGSTSSLEFLSNTASFPAPPVPPRKNLPISKTITAAPNPDEKSGSLLDFDPFSQLNETSASSFTLNAVSSSPSWVNFDDESLQDSKIILQLSPAYHTSELIATIMEEEQTGPLEHENGGLSEIEPSKVEEEEDPLWRKPSSSPDVRSSAIKKKGTRGIGYLCLENDDCDNNVSKDNLDLKEHPETITVLPPENDLSPEKPQSQWATFQNEDYDEDHHNLDIGLIPDDVSRANSTPSIGINSSGFAGSLNDMEGDLDDDFGFGIGNRLSVEMPDLKGFNRADKGSQNNLVDFSDDRGSAVVSTGSHDDPDDEMETILDLTALGDSLKRKRPKGAVHVEMVKDVTDDVFKMTKPESPVSHNNLSFHVGPAGIDDPVFAEEVDLFDILGAKIAKQNLGRNPTPHSSLSSRATTPLDALTEPAGLSANHSKAAASTNPFWSPPTARASSSMSQCSSAADSPFDNVVFNGPNSVQLDTVFSKPSTPLRINPSSTPITPVQLVRIPPPPLSQSRSSSRVKRPSQARERSCNPSHGPASAKKLDLDYASDTSVKTPTVPSSRAETPIQIAINESKVDETATVTVKEGVFDPFSIQPTDFPNSSTATTNIENLFSWADNTSVDPSPLDAQPQPQHSGLVVDDEQDITLVLDQLSEDTQKNTNANANISEKKEVSHTPFSDDAEYESIVDSFPTQTSTTTPDPLLELKKVTSVESPLGIQISKKPLLPEVEIIDAKTSWDVYMRFPPTKRTMSSRKWVPIHVSLVCDQVDNPLVKLYYTRKAPEPFRTVSLASHQMQISNPKLQAHYSDEGQVLGKLHTVKLMVIHYKEKQTFSPRRSLTKNASGFKHACKGKQSIKFGFTLHYDVMSFCKAARDAMFTAHKRVPKSKEEEHTATVKYHSRDEFLVDVQDELQAVVNESGMMEACKVRVHFFVSSFLSGDPVAKITLNDRKVEGREVVRREDIIPTSMEGWIDIRDPELHESCTANSYSEGGDDVGACTIFPPDACRFEMIRFATTYTETELPVTLKTSVTVKGARLQLRCILRMSGNHSANKDPLTQIACEDVMIRFPVPDEWGVFFRVDGRFRNHSVCAKRTAKQRRRPSTEPGVTMEASVGVAKYERAYKAVVWRLPRLPEKNAVQNTPRVFTCRIELNSDGDLNRLKTMENSTEAKGDGYQGGLDEKYKWCEVEYTMAGPTASNVCVRSVSLPNTDRAEKFVSYQSRYFYKVGINVTVESVRTEGEPNTASFCSVQ